jgi:hypothetical protein
MSDRSQMTGAGAGSGALSGAAMGSMFGPWGTALGALAGALSGALGGSAQGGAQEKQQQIALARAGQAQPFKAQPPEGGSSQVNVPGSDQQGGTAVPPPPTPPAEPGQAYTPEDIAAIGGGPTMAQSAGGNVSTPDTSINPEDYLMDVGNVDTGQSSAATPASTPDYMSSATDNLSSMSDLASLLKATGLNDPKSATAALVGGVDMYQKNRAINAQIAAANRAYAIAPGLRPGNTVPIKVGGTQVRKLSPLEEFQMMMRR